MTNIERPFTLEISTEPGILTITIGGDPANALEVGPGSQFHCASPFEIVIADDPVGTLKRIRDAADEALGSLGETSYYATLEQIAGLALGDPGSQSIAAAAL